MDGGSEPGGGWNELEIPESRDLRDEEGNTFERRRGAAPMVNLRVKGNAKRVISRVENSLATSIPFPIVRHRGGGEGIRGETPSEMVRKYFEIRER